jgi:hypothetical protein
VVPTFEPRLTPSAAPTFKPTFTPHYIGHLFIACSGCKIPALVAGFFCIKTRGAHGTSSPDVTQHNKHPQTPININATLEKGKGKKLQYINPHDDEPLPPHNLGTWPNSFPHQEQVLPIQP